MEHMPNLFPQASFRFTLLPQGSEEPAACLLNLVHQEG